MKMFMVEICPLDCYEKIKKWFKPQSMSFWLFIKWKISSNNKFFTRHWRRDKEHLWKPSQTWSTGWIEDSRNKSLLEAAVYLLIKAFFSNALQSGATRYSRCVWGERYGETDDVTVLQSQPIRLIKIRSKWHYTASPRSQPAQQSRRHPFTRPEAAITASTCVVLAWLRHAASRGNVKQVGISAWHIYRLCRFEPTAGFDPIREPRRVETQATNIQGIKAANSRSGGRWLWRHPPPPDEATGPLHFDPHT